MPKSVAGNIEGQLQQQVLAARQSSTPLAICGGNSKTFYGREIVGQPISVAQHSGVIDYHPTELVITARAGTTLREIMALLEKNNQMLGFEPPLFSDSATLGGAIASGLSGPSRPFSGPVNHFVLGVKVLSGRGEVLRFGGQVIKNVAGFDVSRLLVGCLGCLGILLEISLKVVPKPATELTIILHHADADAAIVLMNTLAGKPLPISAAAWVAGKTRIRLSGSKAGVTAARQAIGGKVDAEGAAFWTGIREQTHGFFKVNRAGNRSGRQLDRPLLLRSSVAPATKMFCQNKRQLIDWGGGLRWYSCAERDDNDGRSRASCARDLHAVHGNNVQEFEDAVKSAQGHVTRFRNGDRKSEVFAPLPDMILKFHHRLKNQFDPDGILNPGRMYGAI